MTHNNVLKVYLLAFHDEVTGSRLLLVVHFPDGSVYRIMIDCGYFQEIDYRHLNYEEDINPGNIDAILITHNHIDHTGLLPKIVGNGYSGDIFMSEYTKELLPDFLMDCCEQQEENARDLREKYPNDAWKFDTLYYREDVDKTLKQCKGVKFEKTFEILPGINVTFFKNGHLLGASMILVQCNAYGREPLNFLFTGDYRLTNPFFRVDGLPKAVKDMPLIIIHESTYGSTDSTSVEKCFYNNIINAFEEKKHILIGAFAQGRMQELLDFFRKLEEEGKIPSNYKILVDGPLGIKTTRKYKRILEEFNPKTADFLPKKIEYVDPKSRDSILNQGYEVILLTTSGMLSNGPARTYVPMFLQRKDCIIHITGYPAEETVSRQLLDAQDDEVVKLNGVNYHKSASVFYTKEFTSHAKKDDMFKFLSQFKQIRFLALNHGPALVKEALGKDVNQNCDNVDFVGILNRKTMVGIYQSGTNNEMNIKSLPANADVRSPTNNRKDARKDKKRKKKANSSGRHGYRYRRQSNK